MRRKNDKGFTLIELSVVLVIIGLVVGGVLVGQDLIKAAESRALLSQFQKFEVAARTFQLKYNCHAGDCKNATQFGLGPNGDGNKLIDKGYLHSTPACITVEYLTGNCLTHKPYTPSSDFYVGPHPSFSFASETNYFWVHLSGADLIEGEYSEIPSSGYDEAAINADMQTYFPKDANGKTYLTVFAYNNRNYIRTGVESLYLGRPRYRGNAALNGAQAKQVTDKFSDGTIEDTSVSSNKAYAQYVMPAGNTNGWELFISIKPSHGSVADSCFATSPLRYNFEGNCNLVYRMD